MTRLNGKVFKPRSTGNSINVPKIGQRLSELRQLAGVTQVELAKRLKVGQATMSKLEKRDDMRFSTLKKYIEALGATVRVDAAFSSTSDLVGSIEEAFDVEFTTDDQLVFPIFEDEKFRAQRDVILSIKPQYSSAIFEGNKTVELRRRFPINVPNGTLAYIYSTSPVRALDGVAKIDGVVKHTVSDIWDHFGDRACIDKTAFDEYFTGLDNGYAIVFSEARRLKRSIDLPELRERFNFVPPQSFLYAKPVMREALKYERPDLPH